MLYKFAAPHSFLKIAERLLLCMCLCSLFLFGSAETSHCIVKREDPVSHEVKAVENSDQKYFKVSVSSALEKQRTVGEHEPNYGVFAQLTGLLALIILLVFVWNRKLSKLNESLNIEVSQRRRMEKVHAALNRIALAVTEVDGINDFYRIVQSQVNSLMFARNFFVASYDKEAQRVSFPYFSDEAEEVPKDRNLEYGLTDFVLRNGKALYADRNVRERLKKIGRFEIIGKEAVYWLGVPLKFKGEVVGGIAVQSYDDFHILTRADLEVLIFISSYVGLALERLYLFEQGREQTSALKESEERFRRLFEDTGDATMLFKNQVVIECNPAAYKMMGMSSREEMLGMTTKNLSPEVQPSGISSEELITDILRDATLNGSLRLEWVALKNGQESFPVEVLITPISYRGENISHVVMRDISDRKEKEAALIEREVKYKALFEFSGDAILLMNIDRLTVSANPEAVSMFRCSSEEEFISYEPKTFLPAVQPNGRSSMAMFTEKMEIVLETGGLDYEVVCKRLNGEEFFASVRVRKMVVGGEILFQATLSDITDRHKSSEEIERSVSLLTATIESSADGILAVDGYGRVVAWNSHFSTMWEISDFDLDSGIISDVFGFIVELVDEQESKVPSLWDYSLESEVGQVDELVLKDGRIIERHSNPQRVGLDVVGRVWSFRDVTARRMGEKALQESYHRLSDIVEFLPDPTMVVDTRGVVLEWNKAIEDVTGVRKEDIIGKGNYEYALPFYDERRPILIDCALADFADLPTDRYESVQRKGDILYGEVYTPDAFNGEGAYFWGVAGPLKDGTGEVVGAIECMRNISDRKKGEQELNRARLAAEAATRIKSEFLANMSHEIRTPMNSITGFGHLLQLSSLDFSQKEYLEKIMSSADSLLSIIDEILDFSKIEAGKFVLENVEFELDDVLGKICNMVAIKAEQKGINFVLSVGTEVPHKIVGDPLRLEQVLTNLANNAVKFTGEGEVALLISARNQSAGKADIEFSVKDSGIGLAQSEIKNLFSSFTQADASTTRKYGGTGLGLAITNSLVSQMGGSINVESEPARGSVFSFSAAFEMVESEADFVLPDNLQGMKALVVDDSKLAQVFMGATLEGISFDVTLESSALVAIELLKSAAEEGLGYNIVYMDWKMPGLSGLEAVSIIRRIPSLNNLPVMLMIPVDADEKFKKRAAFNGVDGFITKPVTRFSLYESLRNEFCVEKNSCILPEAESSVSPVYENQERKSCILLVEDNVLNQQVAKRMLEGFGLNVDVAANGRKALEALWAHSYDLILMDIQMPEMDGLTATRLIRSDKRYEDLPILAMTAHAMQGDREKSLEAGMDEHLTKPIDPEVLREALDRFLTKGIAPYEPIGEEYDGPVLPEISGIDCIRGLKNIGGNKAGYFRVLQGFKNDYGTFSAKLKRTVDTSGLEKAGAMLHSLKGVAGNIGAFRLYELCRRLESDVREGDFAGYEAGFGVFSAELKMIIKGLEVVSRRVEKRSREYVYDEEKSFNLINKLYIMLREGDAESYYLLDKLRNFFNPEQFESLLDELTRDIENYDFEDACAVLETIAAELGISLTGR